MRLPTENEYEDIVDEVFEEVICDLPIMKPKTTGYGFAYNNKPQAQHQNNYKEVTKMQNDAKVLYDIEKLEALPIGEVLEYYGAEPIRNDKYKCFNEHSKGKAQIIVYSKGNICKCHNCNEVQGNPIAVAKFVHKGDFKAACEDLHEAFRIPYKNQTARPSVHVKPKRVFNNTPKPIEWTRFDDTKPFKTIDINEFLPRYTRMTDEQKLKTLYSYIYRYSMQTDHTEKTYYYASRKIKDNHYLQYIGWISPKDIKKLCIDLEDLFPIEDLVRFKLYGDTSSKRPLQWKFFTKNGFTVVPSFDLYSDTVNGLMLRQTDHDTKGPKEFQISCTDISIPLPFAITPAMLRKKSVPITICEGHIDGLSLGKPFVAFPGINGYKLEWLGLFEGHKVFIAFDQDDAARTSIYGEYSYDYVDENGEMINGKIIGDKQGYEFIDSLKQKYKNVKFSKSEGLKKRLLKAGATSVEVLKWDTSLGGDINELLENNNLEDAFHVSSN